MFSLTQNIIIRNNGFGFCTTPAIGCFGGVGMCGSIFGGYNPMFGMSNSAAAGWCIGRTLSIPGVLSGIGKGLQWSYNHILKPVGNFAWNKVLKPAGKAIGKAASWLWNNTLGRLFNKK